MGWIKPDYFLLFCACAFTEKWKHMIAEIWKEGGWDCGNAAFFSCSKCGSFHKFLWHSLFCWFLLGFHIVVAENVHNQPGKSKKRCWYFVMFQTLREFVMNRSLLLPLWCFKKYILVYYSNDYSFCCLPLFKIKTVMFMYMVAGVLLNRIKIHMQILCYADFPLFISLVISLINGCFALCIQSLGKTSVYLDFLYEIYDHSVIGK